MSAPRSISAPTIAGCWWRAPARRRASTSSTPSRASSGWARGSRRPACCPRRRWRAPRRAQDLRRQGGAAAASRRARYVATEACRRAANCAEFLERVRARDRHRHRDHLEPSEEARLVVAGCAPLLDPRVPHALVFDIGGGSTELVWLELAGGAARAARCIGASSRCRTASSPCRPLWRPRRDRRRSTTRWSPRCARRSRRFEARHRHRRRASPRARCRCSAARAR